MSTSYVYLVRCADDTLYCGWTTDPEARVRAHNSGRGARYTRSRRPVELVYTEAWENRHEAMSREWRIKRMSRAEKDALIRDSGQETYSAQARNAALGKICLTTKRPAAEQILMNEEDRA